MIWRRRPQNLLKFGRDWVHIGLHRPNYSERPMNSSFYENERFWRLNSVVQRWCIWPSKQSMQDVFASLSLFFWYVPAIRPIKGRLTGPYFARKCLTVVITSLRVGNRGFWITIWRTFLLDFTFSRRKTADFTFHGQTTVCYVNTEQFYPAMRYFDRYGL